MEKYYYVQDENGNCYVVGTPYSFRDQATMEEWAEEMGYEIEETQECSSTRL